MLKRSTDSPPATIYCDSISFFAIVCFASDLLSGCKQKCGRVTGKMAIKAFDEKLRVNRIVNKALAISTALIISLEYKRYYRLRCRRRY